MAIFLCIFAMLVYLSGLYLHRLVFRTIGVLINIKDGPTPTSVIWFLAAIWPLADIYLAIAIAHGVHAARKENAN